MSGGEIQKSQNHLAIMRGFFLRKWFIIVPMAAGLVIATVAGFLIPPSYESYTLILVEEQKTINPLIQNLAVSSSVVQRLQTLREQLLGWNNMVEVIHKAGLDKDVQDQRQMEDMVQQVRGRITVELKLQDILRLAYTCNDPKEALTVVNNLSELFIQENMRSITKETDMAIEFLKQQVEVYKRKIKESEIAGLEEQLNGLKLDATDEHPLVRELVQKIAMARKDLESGNIKIDEEKEKSAQYQAVMRAELAKIAENEQAGQQPDANASIYKLFLMDRLDLSVARDIEVNRQIYNMLLQRLETAKITQRLEASKQGTRYTIIDPPRLPLMPSAPNKPMILLIGLFLGGGAGTGMALVRQAMDQSFLDIEDARNCLGYPVLGAITRITTRGEIEREKDKKIVLVIIGVILSATLIIGSGMIALFTK